MRGGGVLKVGGWSLFSSSKWPDGLSNVGTMASGGSGGEKQSEERDSLQDLGTEGLSTKFFRDRCERYDATKRRDADGLVEERKVMLWRLTLPAGQVASSVCAEGLQSRVTRVRNKRVREAKMRVTLRCSLFV